MAKKKKVSKWDLATLSKKVMLISSIVAALAGTVGGIKTMIESLFSKSANTTASVSNIPTPAPPVPVSEPKAAEKNFAIQELQTQINDSTRKSVKSFGPAVRSSDSVTTSSTALYIALSESALVAESPREQATPISVWKKIQNSWWIFLCGGLLITGVIIWWERRKVEIKIETKA